MTREEAIAKIGHIIDCIELGIFCGEDEEVFEALDLALTALHGPTSEMVERMRGEWISTGSISCKCAKCNKLEPKYRTVEYNFCPICGAPMTDEAVDMMLEKWKGALE